MKKYHVSITASITAHIFKDILANSKEEAIKKFKEQLDNSVELDDMGFNYSCSEPPVEGHDYDSTEIDAYNEDEE